MYTRIPKLITRDIVVTQAFVDYANQEFYKGSYIDRKHCDYLLLEFDLRFGHKEPLVKHPTTYKHDWGWLKELVDAKRISSRNYNITKSKSEDGKTAEQKLAMMRSRVSQGLLTHLLFYNTIDNGEIFKVGQVVPHKFVSYEKADYVLYNMIKSQFDGYYYVCQ